MKRHIQTTVFALVLGTAGFVGCQSDFVPTSGSSDPTDFLNTGKTASFFEAIQVDPRAEESAGPQFAAVGDFNNDGRPDIATAWNESQPIQIHVQQRTSAGEIQFATVPLGGTTPIARVSGLRIADLDADGFDDVVVLVKDTGLIARCDQSREDCDVTENGGIIDNAIEGTIVLFFNPQDPLDLPWEAVPINQAVLAGTDDGFLPEEGGYADINVGEIDGVNGPDIVVTLNSAEGDPAVDTAINSVDVYPNPGGLTARSSETWSRIKVFGDMPAIGACRISDVDDDGDNDIIVTYPNAKSSNIRWLPNPLVNGNGYNVYGAWPPFSPIGQVATLANVIEVADVDGDGADDIMVRSSAGHLVQWFRKPNAPSQTFVRNPWQVYTVAEFAQRVPGAIALGDLTGDGRMNAAIAAEGAVAWFDQFSTRADSVFDIWQENLIIDDSQQNVQSTRSVNTTGLATVITDPNANPNATGGTLVNSMVIADIDGDGLNDIIATLDRSGLSGLSNDALVLFRNTRVNRPSAIAP